ncbi:hypothetical protein BDN70DRAFT_877130 [Pholiota conissans]|uniref:F-box domain-containing protein n=1 Tax=Pholiota conissans TaxID=109636 RepID=A0A9P5Z483_9AGAR|nr:hypothetical protein BDN70DRAFT_877130 [Pholiota conissans]
MHLKTIEQSGSDHDILTEEGHSLMDEAIQHHQDIIERYQTYIEHHLAAIERHKAFILALKSRRNTYAPIARSLPPEILCRIFYFAREQIANINEEDTYEDDEPFDPLSWIAVSHVCCHWRNVALASPSLWACPPLENTRWTNEMVERSKDATLDIYLDIPYSFITSTPVCITGLRLVLSEHSQRIRHISVRANEMSQWEDMKQLLSKASATQLESIELCSSYVVSKVEIKDPTPVFDFDSYFPQELPKLRELQLHYFVVNWSPRSSFLSTLTSLNLDGTLPSPHLTWKDFMDVLKVMSHLEVLQLTDCFPVCPDPEQAVHNASYGFAYLNHLRTLSICCDPQEGAIFLSCITLPQTATIRIDCCVNLNVISLVESVDFSSMFRSLAELYSSMPPPKFQTLMLLPPATPLPGARLELFANALTDEQMIRIHDGEETIPHLDLTITWPSRYPLDMVGTKAAIDMFSSGLPFQDIVHVAFAENAHGFGARTFANTVGGLSRVRSILTTGSAGRILVDALLLDTRLEGSQPLLLFSKLRFPNLSSLYFYETRFGPSDACKEEPESDLRYLPVDSLITCLVERFARSGTRLAKLKFRRCRRLMKNDINLLELQDIVGYLDWDREVLFSDSDSEDDSDDSDDSDSDEDEWKEDEGEDEDEDESDDPEEDEDYIG